MMIEQMKREKKKPIDDEFILHTIKIMCTIEKWEWMTVWEMDTRITFIGY